MREEKYEQRCRGARFRACILGVWEEEGEYEKQIPPVGGGEEARTEEQHDIVARKLHDILTSALGDHWPRHSPD